MVKDELIKKIKAYITTNNVLDFDEQTDVKFLAQGEYNLNFVLTTKANKYVFRVNMGSQLEIENQIKYEYDSLKYLERSTVTPKVFYVDDTLSSFQHGILIMEFLEGVPLKYEDDLMKAATIFSQIHSLDIQKESHFIVEERIFSARITEGERLLQKVWESPLVDRKIKLFFERLLEWAKVNRKKENYFINEPWHVVNNTEVNSHNFIIGEKKSSLIDWEKPVISDPAQDLTQFLSPTTTLWKTNVVLSSAEKEAFFQNYVAGLSGKDRDIRERVQLYTPYLYLRALAWCAFAYVEYHDPNKAIKNIDTFEKIKSYLQIDFLEKLFKDVK